MNMSNIKFCIENNSYFNLKEQQSQTYGAPYVMPMTLHKFLDNHEINYDIVDIEDADYSAWYNINLYFFDFNCDYFTYLNPRVLYKIRHKELRLLFTYGEPDDPFAIDKRLRDLCEAHDIDRESIFFISGNTIADSIDGMAYVCESEYLFEIQNTVTPEPTIFERKTKKYTCLNRVHKQYRKEFVYNLWKDGLTEDAYVSYGNVPNKDNREDYWIVNPKFMNSAIHEERWPKPSRIPPEQYVKGIKHVDASFDRMLPMSADNLNTDNHNDHSMSVDYLFTDSYWNIVMETYLNATGGVFLTEKTFKPIKYGQPFVILGTTGSLAYLKEQGYKTFSPWIDESYDQEENIRWRWYALIELARKFSKTSLEDLHKQHTEMTSVILHNQAWFKRNKRQELEQALKRLP
jgi:hypothetical protein